MSKKLLAVLMAVFMLLGTMTVAFAAETVITDPDDLADGASVEGEGTPLALNTATTTSFTIATDKAFDFYIDPLGLLGVDETEGTSIEDLGDGGVIVMKGAAVEIINECAYDLGVTAEIAVSGTGLTIVDDVDDVADDDTTTALFYFQPSTANVSALDEADFAPTADGIVTPSAGLELEFAFPAADYVIRGNPTDGYTATVVADTGSGSAMTVAGYCNPKGDYSEIADAKIEVTYAAEKVAITDPSYDGSGAFGLLEAATDTDHATVPVNPAIGGSAPSLKVTGAQAGEGDPLVFTFNPGSSEAVIDASRLSYSLDGGAFETVSGAALASNATINAADGTVTLLPFFTGYATGKEVVVRIYLTGDEDYTQLDSAKVTLK